MIKKNHPLSPSYHWLRLGDHLNLGVRGKPGQSSEGLSLRTRFGCEVKGRVVFFHVK